MDLPPTAADDLVSQFPGSTPKLRLMCSYGGHIFPIPHEKSLRYLGGETRMFVVDRCSSLASIVSRLSTSLLHGRRNFSLKYQLPNEELDSLVSLSSDEDLENLIEEYDRIVATTTPSSPPLRLRIFIFFSKPETGASMGALLDDAKSESWFVDALNGVTLLPRGLSDSAAVDGQLLDRVENNEKQIKNAVDAHELFAGMSDSYVVENNSSTSFGSSSSSPSMSNLPPIRVRAEESVRVGIAESVVNKSGSSPYSDVVVHNVEFVGNAREVDQFQAVSEDERSDQSKVQVGFGKPPLPMYLSTQNLQQHNKNGLPYNLPSPGSVASSDSKLLFSQNPVQTTAKENRAPASPIDPGKQVHESNPPHPMVHHHETTYLMPSQPDHEVYSQQQQQLHQLEVQQQGYYTASMRPESETHGSHMPLSGESDQHPNSDSQNQRTHHRQETVFISSPQSAEHQQNLQQHQQRHFIHPSMLQSYETPAVPGQVSEQSRQLFQHQQQNQFVPVSAQVQQHVYHLAPNQADQRLQEQQTPQSQQKAIQGSAQYMHQAPIGQAPVPSYYMYTTQPLHQQVHHQTIYMLPAAQVQPYHTLPQSNNIPDPSLSRYPTQLNASMLPAPAFRTQTQSETTSGTVLMSQTPTLIQHPSGQNQQQYVSYSQFVHPAQSMAVPQVYYSDQQHSNVVPQYQTMNSFPHGHCPLPSEAQAASHLPPTDQHR